jgi:hypothetical protein
MILCAYVVKKNSSEIGVTIFFENRFANYCLIVAQTMNGLRPNDDAMKSRSWYPKIKN